MISVRRFVHSFVCVALGTVSASFTGLSYNDVHDWKFKEVAIHFSATAFLLLSCLSRVFEHRCYERCVIVFLAVLFGNSVAFLTLYLTVDSATPAHKSEVGRQFFTNLFGLIFMLSAWASWRFVLKKGGSGGGGGGTGRTTWPMEGRSNFPIHRLRRKEEEEEDEEEGGGDYSERRREVHLSDEEKEEEEEG